MNIKLTEKAEFYANTHSIDEICEIIDDGKKRKEAGLSLMDLLCLCDIIVSILEKAKQIENGPNEKLISELEEKLASKDLEIEKLKNTINYLTTGGN